MNTRTTVELNVQEIMEEASRLDAKAGHTILSLVLARIELEAAPDDRQRAFWGAVISCLLAGCRSAPACWDEWKNQQ